MNTGKDETPEELTETGEKSGVAAENEDVSTMVPFDPRAITIERKVCSIDAIIRRLKNERINIHPDFQRNAVWDEKRKSQLIESLMLNIPIAIFYVADDGCGNWDVVDGLQRLTAIKEFIIDKKLKLQKLEFWKEYEGMTIDELPAFPFNQIMENEFSFVIIGTRTPESVKYNIFKRINTGGMPLSSQEIRHALYQGNGTKLLEKFAITDSFLQATDKSIKPSRMVDRELILRCLTFLLLDTSGYQNNDTMDNFTVKGLRILNNLDRLDSSGLEKEYGKETLVSVRIRDYAKLEAIFNTGMERNFLLFGRNAFRLSAQTGAASRTPINKALFEVWGRTLALMNNGDFDTLMTKQDALFSLYDKKKKEDEFVRAVSRDSWKKPMVDYRFEQAALLIQEVLGAGKN